MHSKYQRRTAAPHAERGLVWKRQTATVDIPVGTSTGGFVLTAPTTITFVHTVTETASSSGATSSSNSSSQSESSVISGTTSTSAEQSSSTSSESTTPQTPSQTSTSSSTPTISSPAGTDGNNNGTVPLESGALSSTQVPGGAIAAIVIACLIVVIVGLFYLIRSKSRRNRMKRRPLWSRSPSVNAPLGTSSASYEPKPSGYSNAQPRIQFSAPPVPAPPLPQSTNNIPTIQIPGANVTVPPNSYNNAPRAINPGVITPTTNLISTPRALYSLGMNGKRSHFAATVTSTFITTLPDELSIDVGEILRVVAEYDDGWSLCMNMQGEQGMVPVECLDRRQPALRAGVSMTSLASTTTSSQDWRGGRRGSSLRP